MSSNSKKKMLPIKKGLGYLDKVGTHVNPQDVIREMWEAVKEYKIVAEQEKTKRRAIAAQRKITLEKIRAQRQILLYYLSQSFDERRENFDNLFKKLEEAIASGNTEHMALLLQSIVQLAQSSPFKDIVNADAVENLLTDGESTVEF